jgi:hypothetical protein
MDTNALSIIGPKTWGSKEILSISQPFEILNGDFAYPYENNGFVVVRMVLQW